MPNEVLVKYPDGTFKTHLLYRTHEHKEFKEMTNPEEFYKTQNNNTIDTLTSQVTKYGNEVDQLQNQLDLKTEQLSITKDVLRTKLEDRLSELHESEEPDTFEPNPTVEDELNDPKLEKELAHMIDDRP